MSGFANEADTRPPQKQKRAISAQKQKKTAEQLLVQEQHLQLAFPALRDEFERYCLPEKLSAELHSDLVSYLESLDFDSGNGRSSVFSGSGSSFIFPVVFFMPVAACRFSWLSAAGGPQAATKARHQALLRN